MAGLEVSVLHHRSDKVDVMGIETIIYNFVDAVLAALTADPRARAALTAVPASSVEDA